MSGEEWRNGTDRRMKGSSLVSYSTWFPLSSLCSSWGHCPKSYMYGHKNIQWNHALTDFRGPKSFICYRRNSVIAISQYSKYKNYEFHDQEIVSVIGGIPLKADPLERGWTVCIFCKKLVQWKSDITVLKGPGNFGC